MSLRDTAKKTFRRCRRERDAGATRQAILEAARTLFAHDSYERVTIRDIASKAGIDPALVIRYFGSKEDLFLATLDKGDGCSGLPGGDGMSLGHNLIHHYISHWSKQDASDPLLIMIRSASSNDSSDMLRKALNEQFLQPIAEQVGGPDGCLRAELALSQLIGIYIMRSLLHTEALSTIPDEQLIKIVGSVCQHYLSGDLEEKNPSPGTPHYSPELHGL
ncbi:TetR family transcriptional regulator [Ktedonobacter sp. SOSP1-85]|uniref:TetR/AcrR family transcriptional regulator n=1 Tax=Ktedonobacter sp. SOSP1-85 TaxID=2778367 RepID=UPI001915A639|nr:TetR family transcriptional regulator [Ktedonobacter sp. SOSP1-85]GHO81438.1 TetR family transcriptional regulator [Ktedonobacter sp. SOSP1-85]